jgi:hypothetical protein
MQGTHIGLPRPFLRGKTPDPTKSCGSNQQNLGSLPIIRRHPELNHDEDFVIFIAHTQGYKRLVQFAKSGSGGNL